MDNKLEQLVLDLWAEQTRQGICPPDEVDPNRIAEWVSNRTYPPSILEEAVSGDIAAIVLVRTEAGLPVLK